DAHTVEVCAANTPRFECDEEGNRIGLLVEKAATNQFPNARNIGAPMSPTSGVTVTEEYGTAPNGLQESTRIVYGGGANSQGLVLGIHGLVGGVWQSIWVKTSDTLEFVLSDPQTGEYDYHD